MRQGVKKRILKKEGFAQYKLDVPDQTKFGLDEVKDPCALPNLLPRIS